MDDFDDKTLNLFEQHLLLPADHDGRTYDPKLDRARLNAQTLRVFNIMIDRRWRTLAEIGRATCDPEASVSARLRDLRKEKFGAFRVNRRRRGPYTCGLFEYQLLTEDV